MQFRVGPHQYAVRIIAGWITIGSEKCAATHDWNRGEILISDQVKPAKRRSVLFHELRHAWQAELGRPADEESEASNAASFAEDIVDQFEAQGGSAALAALEPSPQTKAPPVPTIEVKASGDPLWETPAERCCQQCPTCSATIPPGNIISEPATMFAPLGRLSVDRAFYCDSCALLVKWTEGATATGLPNGRLLGGPEFVAGAEAQEFVRRNAVLARVHAA